MLSETRAFQEAAVLRTNGMFDHDNLYEGISPKLPSDSDKADANPANLPRGQSN